MSVETIVFLASNRRISPQDWGTAIRSHGFEMDLDQDFDPLTHSGFLPCRYKGQDAGFEYFWQSTEALEPGPDVKAAAGNRDTAVSFVTHADLRELMTAVIAAGVLCALTDGVIWDTESDAFITASEAIEWAKNGEREIGPEL